MISRAGRDRSEQNQATNHKNEMGSTIEHTYRPTDYLKMKNKFRFWFLFVGTNVH